MTLTNPKALAKPETRLIREIDLGMKGIVVSDLFGATLIILSRLEFVSTKIFQDVNEAIEKTNFKRGADSARHPASCRRQCSQKCAVQGN
jgi:hypothetical protein